MQNWYVTKDGDDGNGGKHWSDSKLTVAGVEAVLVSGELNIINFGEGIYDESNDLSNYQVSIVGSPFIPMVHNSAVEFKYTGGAGTVLKWGEHSLISGACILTDSDQTGLNIDGQDLLPSYIKNVFIYVLGSGATGLKIGCQVMEVNNVMLFAAPVADLSNSYLLNITGSDTFPWYCKDVYFVFDPDHPSYPFPESRIWKDDVAGGSGVIPINSCYLQAKALHGGVNSFLTTPDTYPSQAAIKDARPVCGWGGHELLPLIRLYDRAVEADASEVADKATADLIKTDTTAILTDTDAIETRLPSDPADQSLVEAAISVVGGSVDAVGADVDTLLTRIPAEVAQKGHLVNGSGDITPPTNKGLWDALGDGTELAKEGTLSTIVSAISAIPASVWGYASRTLTSFAAFVDDIWDYLTSELTVVGSVGKFIYDSFNTLLASSGDNALTIQLYETGGTTPIADVRGVLRNSGGTAVMEINTSDSNGQLNYTVADGTYKLYLYKRGSYTFTVPTTITVSSGAASPATIYGTPFSPSSPAEQNTCVVYGWLYGIDEAVVSGATVDATLEDKRAYATAKKYASMKLSTTTDANGYWELELVPNSLLSPSGSKYTFSFSNDAYKYSEQKIVPDSTTKEYSTLE